MGHVELLCVLIKAVQQGVYHGCGWMSASMAAFEMEDREGAPDHSTHEMNVGSMHECFRAAVVHFTSSTNSSESVMGRLRERHGRLGAGCV